MWQVNPMGAVSDGSPPPLDAQEALRDWLDGRLAFSADYALREHVRALLARVDDLERANERLRTPPTDDDLLVIKSAISLLSHPRYDAEILARDAWECFERLTARVDDLERERDKWKRLETMEMRRHAETVDRWQAAEAEVARLTAERDAAINERDARRERKVLCEQLGAEVARLRTALSEIAEITPDEDDLAHGDGGYDAGKIARAALSGGAADG